jgi:NADH-quinone oxidoreductase subunit A
MDSWSFLLPILLFVLCAALLAVGLLVAGSLIGPHRQGAVKQMPYESGMDPLHDSRRRFDVRFHVVAIAFLLFDVELLFLYPWAVASRNPQGFPVLEAEMGEGFSRLFVFGEVLVFVSMLALGWLYAWRKGVFRWR